jgi:hypothetical protein
MATIDPNIAMGYRPVQIENPLNQLAAYSQIQGAQQGQQLNALKMQEAQLELADRNALRGLDINNPDFISNVSRINPKLALELAQKQAASKKLGLESTDLETKNLTNRYKQEKDIFQYISTPEQFLARSIHNLNDPLLGPQLKTAGVTEDTIRQRLDAATKQPGGFEQLLKQNILGLDKFIELNKPQYMEQNLGGTNRITALPGLGIGAPTIVSDAKKTKTYADITAEGNLALNRQELANKYDPVLQANLAEAKAAGDYFGKNKAAAAQALPGALENATQAIRLIDEMIGTAEVKDKNGKVIKAAGKEHPGFSNYVGVGFPTRFVEGSDAASFEIRQKQIEGKAFLEAFNTLRGGGAITEKEGEKGTLAIMRMNKATSEAEYKAAARELQEVLRTGVNTMRAKAGQPSGGGGKGGGGGGGVDTSNPLLK